MVDSNDGEYGVDETLRASQIICPICLAVLPKQHKKCPNCRVVGLPRSEAFRQIREKRTQRLSKEVRAQLDMNPTTHQKNIDPQTF